MQPYPLKNGAWERAEARRRRIEAIAGFTILGIAVVILTIVAWAAVHLIEWAGAQQILGAW